MKSMTYGTLPTREEFDAAFDALMAKCGQCSEAPDDCQCDEFVGCQATFSFGNDPRVGTCALTRAELWRELESARRCWDDCSSNSAGDWCSTVLSVLGFEWV